MKKNREHFVTCGQMKILERRADEDGLSYYQMMENAGTRAAEEILDRMEYRRVLQRSGEARSDGEDRVAEAVSVGKSIESPNDDALNGGAACDDNALRDGTAAAHSDLDGGTGKGGAAASDGGVGRAIGNGSDGAAERAFVFCGKGNNGGDGFVVARILSGQGYDVTVILVDGLPKTEDSIVNFELLKELPIRIMDMTVNERALMELKGAPDIIVDAIYGTGFHGKLKSNGLKSAIYINRFSSGEDAAGKDGRTKVFALDIPSGLGGDLTDEKELERSSVTAHYTITFHAKKPVHLQSFAAKYCGRIIVADIGIDEDRLWNVEL